MGSEDLFLEKSMSTPHVHYVVRASILTVFRNHFPKAEFTEIMQILKFIYLSPILI